jgi:hypothetical protein
MTGNNRTRVQDWEQQNECSGLGTTEQGFRTGNNRTKAQDLEKQIKGSGLGTTEEWFRTGTTEQGFRTGNNRTRAEDWEQQNKGWGLGTTQTEGEERSSGFWPGRELVHTEEEDGVHLNTKKIN